MSMGNGDKRSEGEWPAFPREVLEVVARPPDVVVVLVALPLPVLPLRWPRGAGDSVTGLGSMGIGVDIDKPDDATVVPLAEDPIWPSPPANAGISSSSSTQSLSSPADVYVCFPENTSRIDTGSFAGRIARTSIGRCAVRDDQPGGSIPQDFFQLERPTVPLPPYAGLANGPDRFCATNVVVADGLEPSSRDRRGRVLYGDAVLGMASASDGSYHDVGRDDGGEWIDDAAEFERA